MRSVVVRVWIWVRASICFDMRTACLLLTLFASAAVSAQSGEEPIPDPTPPHLYFPLAVGNAWEYLQCNPGVLHTCQYRRSRRTVVDTIRVDGNLYFVEETEQADQGEPWAPAGQSILRYDSTSTRVVALEGGPWYLTECRLAAAFSGDAGCGLIVFGPDLSGFWHSADLLESRSFKSFNSSDDSQDVLEGVGWIGGYVWNDYTTISYAHVLQDDGTVFQYGTQYAVASEDTPEAGGLMLAVGPNPTAGPLTLRLGGWAGETVTLDAFDALGRRVWAREVLGQQPVSVDASGWAPGLYLVRARTGTEGVTTTVVRR